MNRLFNTLWLLALYPTLMLGQGVKRYEYWIDEDYSHHKTVSSNATDVILSVNVGELPVGVHCLNFRCQNTLSEWGSISRWLFYIPELEAEAADVAAYEYWIDDEHSTAKRVTTNQNDMIASLNVSKLPVGVHTFNFRCKNTRGEWGSISRWLFYIPDEPDESQGSPLVGYTYNFNQVATYVPIGEQTSYELKDYIIAIPNLVEIGNLVKGCSFSFDAEANTAHLERTQQVTFSMQFMKKSGAVSTPVATTFTMSDELTRDMSSLGIKQPVTWAKVSIGDFRAFRIDAPDDLDVHLRASQQCSIWMFDEDESLVCAYQKIKTAGSVSLNLAAGTYYGIVYDMVKDEANTKKQLTLSLSLSDVVVNSDDLQDFINNIGNDGGTETNPVTVPVDSEGLVVDGDVSINNELHLLFEGDSNTEEPLAINFSGGIINMSNADCSVAFNNVSMSNNAMARNQYLATASTNGGIANNGKLLLTGCTVDDGLITNNGKVCIDGLTSVSGMHNRRGGRFYVTSQMKKDVRISISEEDVETGTAIISGDNCYTLTAEDAKRISLVLPDSYDWKYDKVGHCVKIISRGDSNEDSTVDVADIATIINYMAGNTIGIDPKCVDVNSDGVVDVADIATVISIMAGK